MYTVAVKIEGMDRRRRTTGLMHLIVGFFLLLKSFDFYNYLVEKNTLKFLPFLIVGGLSLFYGAFRNRIDARAKYNTALRVLQFVGFVFFGIIMMQLGKRFDYTVLFIWALVTFLLIFSEKKIFAETALNLTEEGIRIPGSYKEHLVEWEVLEDVTVRHDFITLFHRDKKYLQYQVMQDLSELEVVKMNAFCREKIEGTTNVKSAGRR
ncbi:hypothetical protein [Flavisolibacter ginsenosidimutans]|uniref:Uncharacterized protein n=1 Tax=Flavisolibacter ginsenosidimutans TaxID=661481 RepID=A0A5B8UEI7_9BACT|nr:hypothetical protein [Flavisolibacter ginsenosidimutans]QEC55091.1 hypothetical protein FSB75_03950 [Flavisolibacter ginsenosidimutans]